jgi:hypothetical protein
LLWIVFVFLNVYILKTCTTNLQRIIKKTQRNLSTGFLSRQMQPVKQELLTLPVQLSSFPFFLFEVVLISLPNFIFSYFRGVMSVPIYVKLDARFVFTPLVLCVVHVYLWYLYLFTYTGIQYDSSNSWCSCCWLITRRVPLVEHVWTACH